MRRVSYHQSVFDLIGLQPPTSSEALGMIEECERQRGQRLPEAVRQWYAIKDVVPLDPVHELDFLIEHLTEDARRPLGDGLMQYEFNNAHGRIRVTTDAPDEEGGVSAWWLHADSEEGLFQLARGVLFCVNLRHALKHWTKTSQPVMERLRELPSR
jgi:hypothetical protein